MSAGTQHLDKHKKDNCARIVTLLYYAHSSRFMLFLVLRFIKTYKADHLLKPNLHFVLYGVTTFDSRDVSGDTATFIFVVCSNNYIG